MTTNNQSAANFSCSRLIAPRFSEYFSRVDSVTSAFIVASCLETVVIFILFGVCCHYISTYVSSHSRSSKLLWLCGIFPMCSFASCLGMIIPRATSLADSAVMIYLAKCLFDFVDLILHLLGGVDQLSGGDHDIKFKLNTGPFCCCCPCLPIVSPSPSRIKRIRCMVYQVAFVKTFCVFVGTVLWMDRWGDFEYNAPWRPFFLAITSVSTLIAMYGVNIFSQATKEALQKYKMHVLMAFIQMLLVIFNLQAPIFAACSGYAGCEDMLLPDYQKTSLWHHMLMVFQCLLMITCAMWFCRPAVNHMFDLYTVSQVKNADENSELSKLNTAS